MKYTILPPQKGPRLPMVFRRPPNLGEHQAAFLNANNKFGFQAIEIPEEPVVEEVAAMWLTVVSNLPKVSKDERRKEAAKHRVKMLNAGYEMRGGVYVKVKTLTEEDYEQTRQAKRRIVKRNQVEAMLVRATPLQEFEAARTDPRWKQPWNHAAYHEGIRKYIVSTRTNFSYRAEVGPLRDDEYRSRLDKLLNELEQQSNIQNPTVRKFVAMEKAKDVLKDQLNQFTPSINIDEFLDSVEPKSDPTGRHRINPYL